MVILSRFDPCLQLVKQCPVVTAIEAPFALLQEEVKTLFGHPVEAPKMPLAWFQKFSIH